jgi:hypothetical protein
MVVPVGAYINFLRTAEGKIQFSFSKKIERRKEEKKLEERCNLFRNGK